MLFFLLVTKQLSTKTETNTSVVQLPLLSNAFLGQYFLKIYIFIERVNY